LEVGAMPKEVIYDAVDCFDVVVKWDRDAYVQVGVVMKYNEDSPSSIRNLRDLTATWTDPESELARGIWSTMNRPGINRLIHSLRKARDQAFGADA
jgi:hypothetical protein